MTPFRYTPLDTGFCTFLTQWPAGRSMAFHCHEAHEINVVVRGSGRYFTEDGKAWPLAAGQILYLSCAVGHGLVVAEDIVMRGLGVHPEVLRKLGRASDRLIRSRTTRRRPSTPGRRNRRRRSATRTMPGFGKRAKPVDVG